MGWLIAGVILLLIGFTPVGVRIRYNAEGALVQVILGLIKLTLVPAKKKEKKPKKKPEKQAKKKEDTIPSEPSPAPKEKKKSGGPITDFLPLVEVALDFLGSFITRLRFDNLELKLILAGDDKCALATNYGKAWAALGNLLPLLDNVMNIKRRNLEIECDFVASQTTVIAAADVTITIGRTLNLLTRYGFRAVKEFLNIKNKRKGGASK